MDVAVPAQLGAEIFAFPPPGERLTRTLVVASWPGHMSGEEGIEDASCWIAAHPDLCARAAAAVTIEHLGATQWVEDPEGSYHPTGQPELYGVWATQGAAVARWTSSTSTWPPGSSPSTPR